VRLGPRDLLGLVKRAAAGWSADNASSMGASVAFYTLLSLAPLLVLVITLAGLVIGHDEAQQLLMSQVSGLLGETGSQGIEVVLQAARNPEGGIIATLVSLATLAVGATTVFAELKSDLDRIWKVQAPKSAGVWGFIRTRLLSFGLVVTIGFLLLVSLAVSAALSFLGTRFFGGAEAAMHVLDFVGSVIVSTLLFGAVYKVLPSTDLTWRDVLVGALVTSVLFWIGKYLIGLYLGKSSTASSFGAAGTVIVTILWVYYSSMIFFFGAEFTRQFALSHGSRREAANADYAREDEDMLVRARRIVTGSDPVLTRREPGRAGT
jgi:membrane protein